MLNFGIQNSNSEHSIDGGESYCLWLLGLAWDAAHLFQDWEIVVMGLNLESIESEDNIIK